MKIALTIAGSDSGGGAGIQADLKTFQQFGVFGTSVIVALTAQNTRGVRAVETVPEAMVAAQLAALAEDLPPAALKTGMLAEVDPRRGWSARRSARTAGRRWWWIRSWSPPPGTGCSRRRPRTSCARACFRSRPWSRPTSTRPPFSPAAPCTTWPSMERAGETLLSYGAGAALVKGGHLAGDEITDVLVTAEGIRHFRRPRLETTLHPRHRLHALGRDHRGARARAGRWRRRWRMPSTTSTAPSPPRRGSAGGTGRWTTRCRCHPETPCHPERSETAVQTTPSISQPLQIPRHPRRHLHHLRVAQPLAGDAGGRIGDRREGRDSASRAPARRSPRRRWTSRPRPRPAAPPSVSPPASRSSARAAWR